MKTPPRTTRLLTLLLLISAFQLFSFSAFSQSSGSTVPNVLLPDYKLNVRAATTADITIATALNNLDTLDGITLATGDRVLVKNQSTASQNGIYVVGTTPARATDSDTWSEMPGAFVIVNGGTAIVAAGAYSWVNTSAVTGTLGSTSITYVAAGASTVSDTVYGAGWNGDTTTAPSKNAVYDKIESLAGGGFDATTIDSPTWSDGANASNIWSFDVSGTDTTFTFGNNNWVFGTGSVDLGSAGVRLSQDGDGAITFLGMGNGSDEDFTFNLDDTANTIVVSSSTNVSNFDFGSIGLTSTGISSFGQASITVSAADATALTVTSSSDNGTAIAGSASGASGIGVTGGTSVSGGVGVLAATSHASGIPLKLQNSGGFNASVTFSGTADRDIVLPNANTKVPVMAQVLTFAGPTAARTITLPDAAFTVARTDAANTFTGTQTFGAIQPSSIELGHASDTTLARSAAGAITLEGVAVPTISSTSTLTKKIVTLTSPLGTDDTYEGTDLTGLVNSGGTTQWDAVYLNGSSQWVLADANGSSTYPARGLATSTQSTTVAVTVILRGIVRNDAWAWTPGGNIYLSTTAGSLTQTAPATTGDKIQIIGFAIDADTMIVNPGTDYGTAP